MSILNQISETVHQDFITRTRVRDQVLLQSRQLTRFSAQAIRAIHRDEVDLALENLKEARQLVDSIKHDLMDFPDLYHQGYTQDAIKEYAEASLVFALLQNQDIPTPQALGLESATYMRGLSEVPGELRRRCLDILRMGYSKEAEHLLGVMDEIYAMLVTMDYPDAITYSLRRNTALVRGIVERTRGDMTLSLREEHLKQSIDRLQKNLDEQGHAPLA